MPYEAKVKEKVTPKTIRFSGDFEYVRYEWRGIPDDKLELARANPYLETRYVEKPVEQVDEFDTLEEDEVIRVLEQDAVDEVIPKKRRRRRKQGAL